MSKMLVGLIKFDLVTPPDSNNTSVGFGIKITFRQFHTSITIQSLKALKITM